MSDKLSDEEFEEYMKFKDLDDKLENIELVIPPNIVGYGD